MSDEIIDLYKRSVDEILKMTFSNGRRPWLSRCGNVANFDSNFPLLPLKFRAVSTYCSLLSYTVCETLLRFQKNFCSYGILKASILVYKLPFPRSAFVCYESESPDTHSRGSRRCYIYLLTESNETVCMLD